MATRRKEPRSRERTAAQDWNSLTWEDLELWAGDRSVQRGRSYQRDGRVTNLVISEEARLLANVAGGARCVVSAWLVPEKKQGVRLDSRCTCPVGHSDCKHAVAVVASNLQAVAEGESVPTAAPDGRRWAKLNAGDIDSED